MDPNVKPGWKTTEFWLTAGASVVSLVLMSALPADHGVMKAAVFAGSVLASLGYQVSRGVTKLNGEKPGVKSTEFWLTVVNTAAGTLMASGAVADVGNVEQTVGLLGATLSAGGYSLSRGLAKKA
jgi:hypothetical protein